MDLAWPYRDRKTPLPYLEEELMLEAWWLLKKNKLFFSSLLFLWLLYYSPGNSQGMALFHLPTWKPHKRPFLINHFLSIALSLAEFFSVLRHQGLWCWSASEPSRMTPVGFIMTNTYKFLLCGTYVIFLILSVSALGPKPHPVYGIYFSDGLLLIELSIGRRVI